MYFLLSVCDITEHIILPCAHTRDLGDLLWCYILNISDIGFNVYLYSLPEKELKYRLLSCAVDYDLVQEDYEEFVVSTVCRIHKMCKEYYDHVSP